MSDITEKQNDAIIALLAMSAIGTKEIHGIVTSAKKDPDSYVNAYNSLDGLLGVTEVAKIAKVAQSTMSEALQSWEIQGIVYNVGNFKKPCYRRLLRLPIRLSKESKPRT